MSNLSEGTRAEIERIAEKGRGVTGWGLLLAEDEAHGDRRAGRKSGDEWLASSDPATAVEGWLLLVLCGWDWEVFSDWGWGSAFCGDCGG
jgi:hypothetical protein